MKKILNLIIALTMSGALFSQANDNCASATTLTSGAARLCSQSIDDPTSTVEAGENTGASTCVTAGTVNQSVWYKFVATSANMFVEFKVQTSSGMFWCAGQLGMAIYNTSTCLPSSGNVLACDSYLNQDGAMVINPTGLTIGNTYLVQISNFYSSKKPACQLTIPDFCIRVGNTPPACTCSSICATGCGYATTPTVLQVTSTCPEFILNPVSDGGTTKNYCYNFVAVNTTVSFSMIISSNCGGGNVTGLTWTLQTSACGANVATGTISNLSATGLVPGTTYVLCYSYSVPTTCHHTSLYPYFVGAATPLPIEFGELYGYNLKDKNIIQWTTVSEFDNDYFSIEHSVDGEIFTSIGEIKGKGSTSDEQYYYFEDESFRNSTNYYRLVQVDYNGERTDSKIILIDNNTTNAKPIKTINLIGHEVGPNYSGLVIDVYEDGSTFKRYQ